MTSTQNNTGPSAIQVFISDDDGEHRMQFHIEQYTAGPICVSLAHEDELYATISVCLSPEIQLASDEFVFKTYGENQGLYQQLIDQDLIQLVRIEQHTLGMLPVCRLTNG